MYDFNKKKSRKEIVGYHKSRKTNYFQTNNLILKHITKDKTN